MVLLSLLGGAACQSKSSIDTAIIIEVTSDLLVPTEINQVALTGQDAGGNALYANTMNLWGENRTSLPFRVGLYPLHGTDAPIHIVVEGRLDGVRKVSRSATLSFIKGRQVVLPISLQAVCAGVDCKIAYQTCLASGSCEPDGVDGSKLPIYVPYRPIPGQDAASTRSEVGPQTDAEVAEVGQDMAPGDQADGSVDAPVDVGIDAPVESDARSGTGTGLGSGSGTAAGTASGSTSVATGTGTETGGGTGTASAIGTATSTAIVTSTVTGTGSGTSVLVTGTETGTGTATGVEPSNRCAGVAATCGPGKNGDCCASLLVPGGTFYRGYDGVDFTDKSYPATVADFYLDKYEITVGRFRKFLEAGMGTQARPPAARDGVHPLISGSGWGPSWNNRLPLTTADLKTAVSCDANNQIWTDTIGANENRPINCITWYVAFAFCAWDGGRLASEAEWNYAASGGSEQRYYPWSDPPTSTIVDDSRAVYCAGACYSIMDVGSVSPKGDGKWGHSDLAGNLLEWTLDWYAPFVNPCINCANVSGTGSRVIKGGNFRGNATYLRSGYRTPDIASPPEARGSGIGARCARNNP